MFQSFTLVSVQSFEDSKTCKVLGKYWPHITTIPFYVVSEVLIRYARFPKNIKRIFSGIQVFQDGRCRPPSLPQIYVFLFALLWDSPLKWKWFVSRLELLGLFWCLRIWQNLLWRVMVTAARSEKYEHQSCSSVPKRESQKLLFGNETE